MAKDRRNAEKTDYGALLRELKDKGPQRLYMLWGAEDYLSESYLEELKKLCVSDCAEFNYHRLDGSSLDMQRLAEAVEAVPFMGEHSLVEVSGFEPNAIKDNRAEQLKDIISDIPEYATLVLMLPTGYEPDGRLGSVKSIKKFGNALEFTSQPRSLLIRWIRKRFAALGKNIGEQECERLIFVSGELMTRLVPEIEKIASYVSGDTITMKHIDTLAQHIPEADVFIMTERLSQRDFDGAAHLMAELLQSGEHPIMLLATIGMQFRKLYTVAVAMDCGKKRDELMEVLGIKYPGIVDKLMQAARGFSTRRLADAVELCAQCDYRMKSSSEDDEAILKELLLRIAVDGEK